MSPQAEMCEVCTYDVYWEDLRGCTTCDRLYCDGCAGHEPYECVDCKANKEYQELREAEMLPEWVKEPIV